MEAKVPNMVFRLPLLLDCQSSGLPSHKDSLGIPKMYFHSKIEYMKGPCQKLMYLTVHNCTKSNNLNRKTAVVWMPTSRAQLYFSLPWFSPFNYRYSK